MREIVPCDARAGLGRKTEGQSSLAFREAFAIELWASHHDRSGCVGRDCGQAAMTSGSSDNTWRCDARAICLCARDRDPKGRDHPIFSGFSV